MLLNFHISPLFSRLTFDSINHDLPYLYYLGLTKAVINCKFLYNSVIIWLLWLLFNYWEVVY